MSRWLAAWAWRIVASTPVTEPPRSLSFPMRCDACLAVSGYPYIATTMKGVTNGVRVAMRCRACGAEWSLDVDSESGRGLSQRTDDGRLD